MASMSADLVTDCLARLNEAHQNGDCATGLFVALGRCRQSGRHSKARSFGSEDAGTLLGDDGGRGHHWALLRWTLDAGQDKDQILSTSQHD